MLSLNLRRYRSHITAIVLLIALAFQGACGTLLHPERRGQSSGRIDPAIAILNGIGLLFFLVPGLIAFAVDFSTGAIYLPPEHASADEEAQPRVVYMDPDEITPEKLVAVIYEHTGVEVTLTEDGTRVISRYAAHDVGADGLKQAN